MELEFIPLDYDHVDIDNQNYIKIYGRDSKGKRVCIIDKVQSYFYVIGKNLEKIKKSLEKHSELSKKIKDIQIVNKNFLDKPIKALKISPFNYKDIKEIGEYAKIIEKNIKRKEKDLNILTRYIIESNLLPLQWHKVKGRILHNDETLRGIDSNLRVDLCLELEKHEKIKEREFIPKILAYDIESAEFEIGKGEILMISLVSEKLKKVLTWKKTSNKDYVEFCKDEKEMLEKFAEIIKKQDPDILVGYFSDGFDMPYIRSRATKHKVKLDLSLDGSQPTLHGGRLRTARTKGLVHIDLLRFIQSVYSQYLQSETLSLNEVSSELLGDKKIDLSHINFDGKLKEKEWEEFFAYNLQDSSLTYRLTEKLWPDIQEFTRLVQEPLHKASRNAMSHHVEDYIIHNAQRFNEIIERGPIHEEIEVRRGRDRYEGAFVMQPVAALYENLASFDFTSMYASVIVSFNLNKAAFLKKKEKDSTEVLLGKRKAYFTKKKSFLAMLLEEIIVKRKKAKQELKSKEDPILKARSNAFKLLANASYGYLGFFNARYYCPDAGAAAAALARKFIKETIEKTNKAGFTVIYADTDGFAFTLNKHNKKQTLDFLKKLNTSLPGIMELELEDFYERGLWVTKRSGEFGAKKKYALINKEGKLRIRGFETVRRDWCRLARDIQNTVLQKILHEGNEKSALECVKKVIKQVKQREIDKKQLIIRTQLRKPLSEYKAITPHVIAAKKIHDKGLPISPGTLVEYFIAETREKKSLVREKVKLPDEKGEYNIKYYLENQILPAVENIFEVFNVNTKEIIEGKKQTKLDGF
ncbi:MAG: DNA-directed DNA polymerase [archaeon]